MTLRVWVLRNMIDQGDNDIRKNGNSCGHVQRIDLSSVDDLYSRKSSPADKLSSVWKTASISKTVLMKIEVEVNGLIFDP